MSATIDQYAVFGNPIAHSKSPILQNEFAKQTQQTINYVAECIDVDGFEKAAAAFFHSGGKGLNITVPFKEKAFDFADQLSSRAQRAGAVNTLAKQNDGSILGDNTDGIGLVSDIQNNLDWQIQDQHILIIGAGGAVRGILEPIINEQPASITIVNRTAEKARFLVEQFSDIYSDIIGGGFTILDNQEFDLIINGTSASLGGDLPPLPDKLIDGSTCCYDMMYSSEPTVFMNWATTRGAKAISDGLGMLVCQGAQSFELWRGVTPKTKPVIKMLRELIGVSN